MRWNGHWVNEPRPKYKYVFGIKDWIKIAFIWIGIVVLMISLFLLNSFRWSL